MYRSLLSKSKPTQLKSVTLLSLKIIKPERTHAQTSLRDGRVQNLDSQLENHIQITGTNQLTSMNQNYLGFKHRYPASQ